MRGRPRTTTPRDIPANFSFFERGFRNHGGDVSRKSIALWSEAFSSVVDLHGLLSSTHAMEKTMRYRTGMSDPDEVDLK